MGFIEIVFYFAIYRVFVLIGTFIYVKFFEKKAIKQSKFQANLQISQIYAKKITTKAYNY